MLSKRKKKYGGENREENPWGSSTFFETPKYPRATDIRSLSVFELMIMFVMNFNNSVVLFERFWLWAWRILGV